MTRRTFLYGLALGLPLPRSAEGQPAGKVQRVGVLSGVTTPATPRGKALLAGLRDFGYSEGHNIAMEWRISGGKAERLPDLAAELVRLNVDVIIAFDNPAIVAAHKATKTLPIVMVLSTDPVGTRFVASLARPGGNITGLTTQSTELQAKALQLLKEALPNASRIAILWDHSEPERRPLAREAEAASRALGLEAQLLGVGSRAELDRVFMTLDRRRPDAMLVHGSQMIFAHRTHIADLATKRLLPTMGWSADTVEAGWLMSYGHLPVPASRLLRGQGAERGKTS
jgi:putative tryptophan/tyrosine transport system substrate-binding protein